MQSAIGRLISDNRFVLASTTSGLEQVMYPPIGAAVELQSNFLEDPWDRILRSLPRIIGSVCSPRREEIARKVRNYHIHIKGEDGQGRPYDALADDTFSYPHFTFVDALVRQNQEYMKDEPAKPSAEEIYGQTVTWYRGYGLPMAPIPPDYASFRKKFEGIRDNESEMTKAAAHVIDLTANRNVPRMPFISPAQWRLVGKPISEVLRLAAFGGMTEDFRRRHNIPFSEADQSKLNVVQAVIRNTAGHLPARFRLNPEAQLYLSDAALEAADV